jgi:hypothetical protein
MKEETPGGSNSRKPLSFISRVGETNSGAGLEVPRRHSLCLEEEWQLQRKSVTVERCLIKVGVGGSGGKVGRVRWCIYWFLLSTTAPSLMFYILFS